MVVPGDNLLFQITQDILLRRLHLHGQHLLRFAAVECQHPVSRQLAYRLRKIIVHLKDRFFPGIFRLGAHRSLFLSHFPNTDTVVRLVGNGLRNDIHSAHECILCTCHFFFFIDKGPCLLKHRLFCHLQQQNIGKGLQSLFLRHRRPRAPLRTVRTVQILHHNQRLCRQNLFLQLLGQLPLLLNGGEHLLLFFFQIAQIRQTLREISKLFVA